MKDFSAFTDYLKGSSPSALDMEFRMLQIVDDDEVDKRPEIISIDLVLDYFIHQVSCKNNYEFMQALLKLFLKIHGETIRCHSRLQEKAAKLLQIHGDVWQRVDKLFQSTRCMLTFFSNSQF